MRLAAKLLLPIMLAFAGLFAIGIARADGMKDYKPRACGDANKLLMATMLYLQEDNSDHIQRLEYPSDQPGEKFSLIVGDTAHRACVVNFAPGDNWGCVLVCGGAPFKLD
jgi:hypothetical protein